MIIIGHPWIAGKKFRTITSLSQIKQTDPAEILLLSSLTESHEIAAYCQKNHLPYAIRSNLLKDALFANALQATYMICDATHAKEIQKIAQEYLFDTRILVEIDREEEMEALAKAGIDGVIFSEEIH